MIEHLQIITKTRKKIASPKRLAKTVIDAEMDRLNHNTNKNEENPSISQEMKRIKEEEEKTKIIIEETKTNVLIKNRVKNKSAAI
jgi:hypothetical protein